MVTGGLLSGSRLISPSSMWSGVSRCRPVILIWRGLGRVLLVGWLRVCRSGLFGSLGLFLKIWGPRRGSLLISWHRRSTRSSMILTVIRSDVRRFGIMRLLFNNTLGFVAAGQLS